MTCRRRFFLRITLGLAIGLVTLTFSSCGDRKDDGRPRVAFVTNGAAGFWTIAKAGALAAGEKFDAEVDVRFPKGPDRQKNTMEDLVTRGVDGIAISPIDPKNQTPLIDEWCRATTIITHDSDAPESKRLCYIGMDNYEAGRLCGELVKEALPGGGKIMIFVGRMEQHNARGRRQGLIDELMNRSHDSSRFDAPGSSIVGEKYTILGTFTDQMDHGIGKANAENAIAKHGDIAAMIGLFEYNAPLCLEAVKQAGKLDAIKIVAFDEADATLQAIEDGHVFGTVVQDPYRYGYESVRILAALKRGDRSVVPASGFLNIPARQIRKANVVEFRRDLKAKLAAGE